MKKPTKEYLLFLTTRVVGMAVDSLVLAAAYLASILLRFDLHAPRWGWGTMALTFISVLAVHLVSLLVTGCYRLAWRRTRLDDIPRYVLACFLSCLALTALRYLSPFDDYAHIRPPYTVTLICFFLAAIVIPAWRTIWTWFWESVHRNDQLLERPEHEMTDVSVVEFFRDKVVMVTGAGGSIGSEIVRQLAKMPLKRLLMVERGENALYEIDRECRGGFCMPLMKDINDLDAMRAIFAEYHPEVVLHAAAYKHVPMVEANPEEGWRNNTEATRHLAEISAEYGVRRFVMISTDKAVNPVSVMGKTKRAAEEAVMAMKGDTSFCAVRFGNVLGSSGSVVPLFREQIAKHKPITITHPDMKRYFMTISEAVGLVLQAATRNEKAIYTLDMGEPVRIVDLAEDMIRQAGYRPYIDIPIEFIGIRPGEKLFEELDVSEKSCYRTDMAKIYITR